MSSVVEMIHKCVPRESIDKNRLKRQGCSLSSQGIPKHKVIVDLDKIGTHDGRADFVVAWNAGGGYVISIEMKRGAPKVNRVVEQLRAGARIAENWISNEPVGNFQAILVAGKFPQGVVKELKRKNNRVKFGSRRYPIYLLKCGSPLKEALIKGVLATE